MEFNLKLNTYLATDTAAIVLTDCKKTLTELLWLLTSLSLMGGRTCGLGDGHGEDRVFCFGGRGGGAKLEIGTWYSSCDACYSRWEV